MTDLKGTTGTVTMAFIIVTIASAPMTLFFAAPDTHFSSVMLTPSYSEIPE
jgi:hypothetical protein